MFAQLSRSKNPDDGQARARVAASHAGACRRHGAANLSVARPRSGADCIPSQPAYSRTRCRFLPWSEAAEPSSAAPKRQLGLHRCIRGRQDPEAARRQGSEKLILGAGQVEPRHSLVAPEHGHLAVVERREVGVRLDRQDRIGLGPALGRRPPNPRKIEPVAVGEGVGIGSAAALVMDLRSGDQAAMARKAAALGANQREGPASRFARAAGPTAARPSRCRRRPGAR